MRRRLSGFFAIPFLRRIAWHVRRVTRQFEGKVTRKMGVGLGAILALAALVVTFTEKDASRLLNSVFITESAPRGADSVAKTASC